jgi:hypothetical protein
MSAPQPPRMRPRARQAVPDRTVVAWRRAGMAAVSVLAAAAAAAVAIAGCGSTPAPAVSPPAAPAPPPLATSFSGTAGPSWTVVEMGGSAAQENNFWELFVRAPGTTAWRLATPLGVADNGGLVVASPGSGTLVTGFRPSQDLTFSPLAASTDNGANWSPAGPLGAGLAGVPDALAAGPDGALIALTGGGAEAELGQRLGAAWTRLSSARSLAATPAGKPCAVTGLTAAAFSGGTTVLGASCGRPGVAGIFTRSGGAWHAAGPALPASLAGDDVDVLGLTADGTGIGALLQAGAGAHASLIAAWSGGSGWTLSAPLPVGGRQLRSTAFGPGPAVGVILSGGRGETLSGPGGSWHALPPLPARASTLVLGQQVDAVVAGGGTFSDWRLGPAGWSLAQTVHVNIPYGSSG